jgi:hypothetical protein
LGLLITFQVGEARPGYISQLQLGLLITFHAIEAQRLNSSDEALDYPKCSRGTAPQFASFSLGLLITFHAGEARPGFISQLQLGLLITFHAIEAHCLNSSVGALDYLSCSRGTAPHFASFTVVWGS